MIQGEHLTHKQEMLVALCRKYDVEIVKASEMNKEYECVGFVQAYNEEKHAPAFHSNIMKFADALVFLDDGSVDNTAAAFMDDAVIIHVKRNNNSAFDDFANRCLLFDIAKIINTKWLLFLDLDERLDLRYLKAFKSLLRKNNVELVRFRYVHLWDSDNKFRADYPYSNNGVQYRLKMMRKKESMQLNYNSKLHFELQPYESTLVLCSPILIIHWGNLKESDRRRRYNNYKKLDPHNESQSSYEHLISEDVILRNVKELYKVNFLSFVKKVKAQFQNYLTCSIR